MYSTSCSHTNTAAHRRLHHIRHAKTYSRIGAASASEGCQDPEAGHERGSHGKSRSTHLVPEEFRVHLRATKQPGFGTQIHNNLGSAPFKGSWPGPLQLLPWLGALGGGPVPGEKRWCESRWIGLPLELYRLSVRGEKRIGVLRAASPAF